MKKFIDGNGKLFGLINPVDLGVVLLLLLLAISVIHQYLPTQLQVKEKNIVVKLVLHDVPPYIGESISGGEPVYLDGSNVELGKISTKTVQPAELLIREDEKMLLIRSPRNQDVVLEINSKAGVLSGNGRSGVFVSGYALRIGDTLKAHTQSTAIPGKIEQLRVNP